MAYPWLFQVNQEPDSEDVAVPVPAEYVPDTGKVMATRDSRELVAYLLSLKQTPILTVNKPLELEDVKPVI